MRLYKSSKIPYLVLVSFILPSIVSAASIKSIFTGATNLLSSAVNLLMILAVAVFLWGIVKFIASAGNPEKLKSAKWLIIYGLIGLFVLVSYWGLVAVLKSTFF